MTEFFKFFIDMISGIFTLLKYPTFEVWGYGVRFFDIILGFIIIGFVVGLYWRGAKN